MKYLVKVLGANLYVVAHNYIDENHTTREWVRWGSRNAAIEVPVWVAERIGRKMPTQVYWFPA